MQFLSGWTTLEELSSWQDVLMIAAAVLAILAAVAGGLAYNVGKKADRIGRQRSWQGVLTIAGVVLAILAAVAGGLAYNVGKKADKLKDQEIQDLQGKLSKATESFQVTEQQLTVAIDELGEAESRISGLEEKQKPRRITPEQKGKMVSYLRGRKALKLRIEFPNGDIEADEFANDFVEVFINGGWAVEIGSYLSQRPRFGLHIYISITDENDIPMVAHAVHRTLMVGSFSNVGGTRADVGHGDVLLSVGSKK